jgi:hypothetical protein
VSVHAYFAEKETLLDLFQDWPDHMGVVALLEETEGHHISLYHVEETDRVLGRLCRRLALPPEELILVSPEGVGPEAPDHPRVRIRFSEDREVLELIRRQRDLPERARDYRVNFEYVRDQGLGTGLDADLNPITPDGEEPLVFSPIPRPSGPKSAWGRWADTLEGGDQEEEPGRVASEDRFRPADGAGEDLASFDVPVDPDRTRDYRVLAGEIRARGALLELRLRGAGRGREEVRTAPVMGFRDDLSDFLLPSDAFEPGEDGAGVCLELPRDLFPDGMIGQVGALPRHARIALTPWGARVRPDPGPFGLIRPWLTRPVLIGLGLLLLAALLVGLIGPLADGSPPAGTGG